MSQQEFEDSDESLRLQLAGQEFEDSDESLRLQLAGQEFEGSDESLRLQLGGARVGSYIRIETNGVLCEFIENLDPLSPSLWEGCCRGRPSQGM